jgi:serine/threonine protein phosphatase PrpC
VLDGMGGHGHGREAAEAVVAGLLAMPACATLAELSGRLDVLHASLQAQFCAGAAPDKRPGTTLTMLELRPGQAALLYHVGDSRLYEIRAGRIFPLTVDHVPATVYAMQGLLTEAEWWQQVHGEHRTQISQAFILGNAFATPAELDDPLYALSPLNLPPFLYHLPDRRALELDPDAVYLLATDGFWACPAPQTWVVHWAQLLDGRCSARAMCTRLFDEMLQRPPPGLHPDNLTAIVLRTHAADDTALPCHHE